MAAKRLVFLHDSFRAEALLAQGYTPHQDLASDRYDEVVRFSHDLLASSRAHTADDLLQQLQHGWAYALHLHESNVPEALDAIEHVHRLLETQAHLLRDHAAEAQRWQRDIRRQRGRSLYKFLGDFRGALETYALNYQERQADGDELGQIRELNTAAKVFHDTCNFPAALALLGRCLTYWEGALRSPGLDPAYARVLTDGLARSLGALGETLFKLNDIQGAMACFEQNRTLMADIAGDVARADIRLADCAMALALQTSGATQTQHLRRAEHYLQQAEASYQDQPYERGFVLKSQLKLQLIQRRWADAVAMAERSLGEVPMAFIKGYLLLYQGQALLAQDAPEAAGTAFASSATAFVQEHYILEAAGARLAQSAAQLRTGQDGQHSLHEAAGLVQTFQQQYASLRTEYFHAEIKRWWPESLVSLEQRAPGLQQRLVGPYASAPAFFAHLNTIITQTTTVVSTPPLATPARDEAVRQLLQASSLVST